VSFALTLSHSGTALAHTCKCLFWFFLSFLSLLPNLLTRSCNRRTPLLIQKGCARAGQKVQPRQVGQSAAPNNSIALGKGGERIGKVSVALTLLHSGTALALANVFLVFSCLCILKPTLEVVQRAHPSFNPKRMCPRWAESPAAPGGPKRHT
jgi:hypothetical protein